MKSRILFSAVVTAACLVNTSAFADFSSEVVSSFNGARLDYSLNMVPNQTTTLYANSFDHPGATQYFIFDEAERMGSRLGLDNAFYRVKPNGVAPGYCMDVLGGSTGNGAQYGLFGCKMRGNGGRPDNQLFRLVPSLFVAGAYQIQAVHSGACLTLGQPTMSPAGPTPVMPPRPPRPGMPPRHPRPVPVPVVYSVSQQTCMGTFDREDLLKTQLWHIQVPGQDPGRYVPGPGRPVHPGPQPGNPYDRGPRP